MRHPTTEAELFDYLHERFGIGTYDELAANKRQWWQERGTGIAKLRAMLKRRQQRIDDVVIAADYAAQLRKHIRYYPQIFELIPEAKKQAADRRREDRRQGLRDQIQDAASHAFELGREEWGQRLLRAPEHDAQAVLDLWEVELHG